MVAGISSVRPPSYADNWLSYDVVERRRDIQPALQLAYQLYDDPDRFSVDEAIKEIAKLGLMHFDDEPGYLSSRLLYKAMRIGLLQILSGERERNLWSHQRKTRSAIQREWRTLQIVTGGGEEFDGNSFCAKRGNVFPISTMCQ